VRQRRRTRIRIQRRAMRDDEQRAVVGSHRRDLQQPALSASRMGPTRIERTGGNRNSTPQLTICWQPWLRQRVTCSPISARARLHFLETRIEPLRHTSPSSAVFLAEFLEGWIDATDPRTDQSRSAGVMDIE
jgi:hypothetical protein